MSLTFALLYAAFVIIAALIFGRHRKKMIEKEMDRLKSDQTTRIRRR